MKSSHSTTLRVASILIIATLTGVYARQHFSAPSQPGDNTPLIDANISHTTLDTQGGSLDATVEQFLGNDTLGDYSSSNEYGPGDKVTHTSTPSNNNCNPIECGNGIYNSKPCAVGSLDVTVLDATASTWTTGVNWTCEYNSYSKSCNGKCDDGYVWNGAECVAIKNPICDRGDISCRQGPTTTISHGIKCGGKENDNIILDMKVCCDVGYISAKIGNDVGCVPIQCNAKQVSDEYPDRTINPGSYAYLTKGSTQNHEVTSCRIDCSSNGTATESNCTTTCEDGYDKTDFHGDSQCCRNLCEGSATDIKVDWNGVYLDWDENYYYNKTDKSAVSSLPRCNSSNNGWIYFRVEAINESESQYVSNSQLQYQSWEDQFGDLGSYDEKWVMYSCVRSQSGGGKEFQYVDSYAFKYAFDSQNNQKVDRNEPQQSFAWKEGIFYHENDGIVDEYNENSLPSCSNTDDLGKKYYFAGMFGGGENNYNADMVWFSRECKEVNTSPTISYTKHTDIRPRYPRRKDCKAFGTDSCPSVCSVEPSCSCKNGGKLERDNEGNSRCQREGKIKWKIEEGAKQIDNPACHWYSLYEYDAAINKFGFDRKYEFRKSGGHDECHKTTGKRGHRRQRRVKIYTEDVVVKKDMPCCKKVTYTHDKYRNYRVYCANLWEYSCHRFRENRYGITSVAEGNISVNDLGNTYTSKLEVISTNPNLMRDKPDPKLMLWAATEKGRNGGNANINCKSWGTFNNDGKCQ